MCAYGALWMETFVWYIYFTLQIVNLSFWINNVIEFLREYRLCMKVISNLFLTKHTNHTNEYDI